MFEVNPAEPQLPQNQQQYTKRCNNSQSIFQTLSSRTKLLVLTKSPMLTKLLELSKLLVEAAVLCASFSLAVTYVSSAICRQRI
eukprot:m.213398 g.213398  ORF g.213398 m.213398 type:complete len:84 (-) comp25578_c0_seq1:958-1209(-)